MTPPEDPRRRLEQPAENPAHPRRLGQSAEDPAHPRRLGQSAARGGTGGQGGTPAPGALPTGPGPDPAADAPGAPDPAPSKTPPHNPTPPPAPGITTHQAGPHALLLELPDAERTAALHAELLTRRATGTLPPVTEIVPGARTVLLDGVPDPEALARDLRTWQVAAAPPTDGEIITLPVVYDGPDLPEVAALWGIPEAEVAARHCAYTYRVAFCGFAPGFGYLTGLPDPLHVPRRATPRTKVPAGALALAGPYSAVYPRATPGGWQIIGTYPDPERLWDPARGEGAALLTPGTRVRFVPAGGAA